MQHFRLPTLLSAHARCKIIFTIAAEPSLANVWFLRIPSGFSEYLTDHIKGRRSPLPGDIRDSLITDILAAGTCSNRVDIQPDLIFQLIKGVEQEVEKESTRILQERYQHPESVRTQRSVSKEPASGHLSRLYELQKTMRDMVQQPVIIEKQPRSSGDSSKMQHQSKTCGTTSTTVPPLDHSIDVISRLSISPKGSSAANVFWQRLLKSWSKIIRPRVSPGMKRIEWNCVSQNT